MSAYYGNLLSANLPTLGHHHQENFLSSSTSSTSADTVAKYVDSGYYSSGGGGGGGGPGSNGSGTYSDSDSLHNMTRFGSPYDRLDIHTLGATAKHSSFTPNNYPPPSPLNINTPVSTYGQYPDDLAAGGGNGCSTPGVGAKLPESAAAGGMVSSSAGGAVGPNTPSGMMHHHFGTNGLSSMVNSMTGHPPPHPQSQNLPIYPWMRPLSGGELGKSPFWYLYTPFL